MKRTAPVLRALSIAVLLILIVVLAHAAASTRPTIVFMTDFGHVDDAVPICKGVMLGINPELRIIDLTHDVQAFSIVQGARFLAGTTPYYPEGTVFVVVVDPGVGSKRKAIVARSNRGQFFVLPDNGLLTLVQDQEGIAEVRIITNPKWMIGSALSSTFHGRDIFSPVGAHVSKGENWKDVGPEMPVGQLVRLNIQRAVVEAGVLRAAVIDTDGPFGNLVTNVGREDFAKLGYQLGDKVPVTLDGKNMAILFVKTFSDVPVGQPLFFIDSRGRLSLAVNQGNFSELFKVKPPTPFEIHSKSAAR